MSYVLAIEPDEDQAGILRHAVDSTARATLTVVDSMHAAMAAIDEEVPHLVLVSALMPPAEEGALLTRLRRVPRDTAPQILIIPALAPAETRPKRTLFDRLRGRTVRSTGCDPSAFAEQLSAYLDHVDRRLRETSRPQPALLPLPAKSGADRRTAVRFEHVDWTRVLVDGAAVNLVDFSITGAQILAPMVLRPGGSVQVLLSRQERAIRCEAGVVWGGFEIGGAMDGPWYRAGINFKETDRNAVERFYFEQG